MRWLSVRLDAMTISVTFVIGLFVVFSTIYPEVLGETSASFAGLALSYAISVSEQPENQLKVDKFRTFTTNNSISRREVIYEMH